jgi:hypothetical protein
MTIGKLGIQQLQGELHDQCQWKTVKIIGIKYRTTFIKIRNYCNVGASFFLGYLRLAVFI